VCKYSQNLSELTRIYYVYRWGQFRVGVRVRDRVKVKVRVWITVRLALPYCNI